MRPRSALRLVGTFALLSALEDPAARASMPEPALVVHEWGTFRSKVTPDGRPVPWHPLEEPSDLPGFVYTSGLKGRLRATVRMETPILYFYSDRETRVSVRVGFPRGTMTEWYPRARAGGSEITWPAIDLLPGTAPDFPVEGRQSHYYPARETAATPLCACTGRRPERERFLFYRGVGSFDLPLSTVVEDGAVLLTPLGAREIHAVVLIERREGRLGYAVQERLVGETRIGRPSLGDSDDALACELQRLLLGEGLYEDEARAMVATWRETWLGEGLRILYLVPPDFTDAVLPLVVTPRPAELVRVLVGRIDFVGPLRSRTTFAAPPSSAAPARRASLCPRPAWAGTSGRGR